MSFVPSPLRQRICARHIGETARGPGVEARSALQRRGIDDRGLVLIDPIEVDLCAVGPGLSPNGMTMNAMPWLMLIDRSAPTDCDGAS